MADQASSGLLRIAFVFGDAALSAHVREAVKGYAEVVYATSGTEFDEVQLADARVAAALVNVDGGDWLDEIEVKLQAAGARVVFNDPEISQDLEGWERARWLRHLVAKLRGSMDFDPPRPLASTVAMTAVASDAPSPLVATPAEEMMTVPEAVAVSDVVPAREEAVVERPLSPREIETMTADFAARPELLEIETPQTYASDDSAQAVAQVASLDTPSSGSPETIEPVADNAVRVESPAATLSEAPHVPTLDVEPVVSVEATTSPQADSDTAGLLDVDTEALSAMIDARLAEPQSHGSSDEGEAWAVSDAPPARVHSEQADQACNTSMPEQPTAHPHGEETPMPQQDAPAAPVVTTAGDSDADVLASLPSLDDWRLLDPDTEVAPAAKPVSENNVPAPAMPDSFADLELVPMETIVPIQRNTDPIERWLDESETVRKAQADGNKS